MPKSDTLRVDASSLTKTGLLALGLSVASITAQAHNPDTSTLVLSQATNGEYLVTLEGSLTGVEAQINQTYLPDAYSTAEQFQTLAREHFVNSMTLSINDQPITIANASMQLGHGTQFIANAQDVPETITSIKLSNTFFKNLHGNKMSVIFLSNQLPSDRYVLNDANQHKLSLSLVDGQWRENSSNDVSETSHSYSHDIEANHPVIDPSVDNDNLDNSRIDESAKSALDSDTQQALATMTQKSTNTPLSSAVYILGIGAMLAILFSMLWFIKKKS